MTLQPPAVPLFVAGTPGADMPAAMNTLVRDPLTFLLDAPTVRLRRTTALAIAPGHQFIAWNVADEDSEAGWTIADPTKYTVKAPGWYSATATVSLSGTGAAGLVLVPSIAVNGGSNTGIGASGWEGCVPYVPIGAAAQPKVAPGCWPVYCNLGDYVQVDLWYSSEGTITAVDTTAGIECSLRMVWAGL